VPNFPRLRALALFGRRPGVLRCGTVDQTDARFSELRFGLGMQPIGHAFKSNPTTASLVLTAIFPSSFRDGM
jgi:hypothetical protein